MTRQEEDALLAQLNELDRRSRRMYQRIVEARMAGGRDDAAIAELAVISKQHAALTTPVFERAVA